MMKIFTKLLILLAFSFFTENALAKIIYVNAANGAAAIKDGTTWSNAFVSLQEALDVALANDQIWVAKGIYKPSAILGAGVDNRDKTFVLKEGVKLYGGFLGSEGTSYDLGLRDLAANETILSGDIDNNDNIDGTINGANAYHVVLFYDVDNTTLLDGFTISGGKADINSSNTFYGTVANNDHILRGAGAGIFIRKSSPTLNKLVIKGNVASILGGAGIYIGRSKPSLVATLTKTTISNSIISNNIADGTNTNGQGAGIYVIGDDTYINGIDLNNVTLSKNAANRVGGIYVSNYVDISLQDVYFSENTSTIGQGGGLYSIGNVNSKNKLAFNNCSFIKNTAASASGGGMAINSHSDASITNTIFSENVANNGGGIYLVSVAGSINNLIVEGTSFTGNTAGTNATNSSYGGALYLDNNTKSLFKNINVNRNIANAAGGIYNAGANNTLEIHNAIFYENEVQNGTNNGNGGAFTNTSSAQSILTGITFYGNKALGAGGALRIISGVAKIYNTIIYANTGTAADISVTGGTLDLKNVITQAYGTNGVDGVKVGAVPLFLSTTYGDGNFLKLQPLISNPAIDAGDSDILTALNITTDLAGQARIHNGAVDLGAYENLSTLPIKLLDFSVKVRNNAVEINWLTETEDNNDYFLLERSFDGLNYSLLSKTYSKGNGAAYGYIDYRPLANRTSYYRLTQIDKDGTSVSFDPKAVKFSLQDQAAVNVYPNPAVGGTITINLAGNNFTTLQVVNLQGKCLQLLNINSPELEKTIDISSYPSGVYFIRLSNGLKVLSKKIVKP